MLWWPSSSRTSPHLPRRLRSKLLGLSLARAESFVKHDARKVMSLAGVFIWRQCFGRVADDKPWPTGQERLSQQRLSQLQPHTFLFPLLYEAVQVVEGRIKLSRGIHERLVELRVVHELPGRPLAGVDLAGNGLDRVE